MKDDSDLRREARRFSLAPNHELMLIPYTFAYISLLTTAVVITPRGQGFGFERAVDLAVVLGFWTWALYVVFFDEKRHLRLNHDSVIDRPYEDRALQKCARLWSTLIPAHLALAVVLESSATSDRIFQLHENGTFLVVGRVVDQALAFLPAAVWDVFLIDAADRAMMLIVATFFAFFGVSYVMRATGRPYLLGGTALATATLALLFFWIDIIFMGPPIH